LTKEPSLLPRGLKLDMGILNPKFYPTNDVKIGPSIPPKK
jgi:hypothetical protein